VLWFRRLATAEANSVGDTLATSSYTGLPTQRIQAGVAGVTSHGAPDSTSVAWQEYEHVRLRAQRDPFGFTVVDLRWLQKAPGHDGSKYTLITINEPSFHRRTRRFGDDSRHFAPDLLLPEIPGRRDEFEASSPRSCLTLTLPAVKRAFAPTALALDLLPAAGCQLTTARPAATRHTLVAAGRAAPGRPRGSSGGWKEGGEPSTRTRGDAAVRHSSTTKNRTR
jgi:hypothetical protein